jgi:hypothetical protein
LLSVALILAFVVPIGFVLSLESVPSLAQGIYPVTAPVATAVVALPSSVRVGRAAFEFHEEGLDAAGLLTVGTMLFGLAAVIRRAV